MNFEIKGTVKGGSLSVGGATFESVEALENAYPVVIDIINVRTTTYLAHSDTYNQKVTINPNPSLTWAEGSAFEGEGETAVVLKQQVNDPNA